MTVNVEHQIVSISSFLPSLHILNLTILQVQECGNKWRLYIVHTLIMPVSYKIQAHVCKNTVWWLIFRDINFWGLTKSEYFVTIISRMSKHAVGFQQSWNFEAKYFQGYVKSAKPLKFCILKSKSPYGNSINIHPQSQLSLAKNSYLLPWPFKIFFLYKQMQDMGQNIFFSSMINCKAIQAWSDAHHLNSLCGKPIMLNLL